MADEVDLANDQLASELSRAINRARKNASESIDVSANTQFCIDCGDDIPEARRELGFRFCIVCAESRERQRALFGGE